MLRSGSGLCFCVWNRIYGWIWYILWKHLRKHLVRKWHVQCQYKSFSRTIYIHKTCCPETSVGIHNFPTAFNNDLASSRILDDQRLWRSVSFQWISNKCFESVLRHFKSSVSVCKQFPWLCYQSHTNMFYVMMHVLAKSKTIASSVQFLQYSVTGLTSSLLITEV